LNVTSKNNMKDRRKVYTCSVN